MLCRNAFFICLNVLEKETISLRPPNLLFMWNIKYQMRMYMFYAKKFVSFLSFNLLMWPWLLGLSAVIAEDNHASQGTLCLQKNWQNRQYFVWNKNTLSCWLNSWIGLWKLPWKLVVDSHTRGSWSRRFSSFLCIDGALSIAQVPLADANSYCLVSEFLVWQ